MDSQVVVSETVKFVKETLENDSSGHDWWHTYRVWKLAKTIAKNEPADQTTVELAALLHDIADWKFHDGDSTVGAQKAKDFLQQFDIEKTKIDNVYFTIKHISFKGVSSVEEELSLEGQIVQDADRLDAIGAIGIARVFAYGGSKGRLIYDPNIKPVFHKSIDSYLTHPSPSINHFYEKLLLLKDKMNTTYGLQLAEKRHMFMQSYLEEFYKEWDGLA